MKIVSAPTPRPSGQTDASTRMVPPPASAPPAPPPPPSGRPGRSTELLTTAEHQIVADLGEIWGRLHGIVGSGPSRRADLDELRQHIHALQSAVLSQAAARAYPNEYRQLGESLK